MTLVDLEIARGRLHDADRKSPGHSVSPRSVRRTIRRGTADMWVAASRVTWERGGTREPATLPTLAAELVEALSSRELDVLHLLGSDRDGPGIARELNVSVNTLRTHTQHVHAKLGVNNRRAAVRRGHQRNL